MTEDANDERRYSRPVDVDAAGVEQSELEILRLMQTSFAMWGVGFEIMRGYMEEWTTRRRAHLQEAMLKLNDAALLENSELRTSAVSDIFVEQIQGSIKDFAAAGYKAMTYAGAYGKKMAQTQPGPGAAMGMPMGDPFGKGFGTGTPDQQPPRTRSAPEAPLEHRGPSRSRRKGKQ